jgi:hypothetical protein
VLAGCPCIGGAAEVRGVLSIVLALAAAVSFSVSDYLAGLAARAADVVTVTAVDQVIFAIVLLFVVPFVSSDGPSVAGLAWGAAAGIGGAAGAMALYLGFRQDVQRGQLSQRRRLGRVLSTGRPAVR